MAWTIKPAIKAWRSSGEQSACGCCCHLLLSSWAWWAALPMTGRERLVRARSQSSLSTRCWSPHLWGAEGAVGNLAVDVMWRPSIGIDRCSRGRTPTFGRSFSKFVQCILRSLLLHLNTRSFYPADIIDHIFFVLFLDPVDCINTTDQHHFYSAFTFLTNRPDIVSETLIQNHASTIIDQDDSRLPLAGPASAH